MVLLLFIELVFWQIHLLYNLDGTVNKERAEQKRER